MKKPNCLFLLSWMCLAVAGESPQRVTVNFIQSEQYADVALSGSSTDRTRQYILDNLEDYLVSLANNKLPQNTRLTIDILDIDMAGRYEPWQSQMLNNVRFIRDIYPPKIKLHYTWLDAQGKVRASAEDVLNDLAYLQHADPGYVNNDPLRYEKTLLRRWFEQRFVGAKAN